MKKHFLVFIAITISICSFSQVNTKKLDSLFDLLAANNKAMGSVALSKNGKLLYTRAIGERYINGDKKLEANTDTKYRIGSISKMFTAVMVFQLIEEKKLRLDTKLSQFFSTIPNADKITMAHLLGHRSGIHNFTDDENYLQWNTRPMTQQQMVELISKNKADFEPGAKADYSNSNYVLLGYIVEKVTGKNYKENLDKRVLSKAGLKNTAVGGKTSADRNESFSYAFAGKWEQQSETDMSIPGGAGAIISTPSDLVKFITALFTNKLVSPASLSQMKDIKDGYGMAMFRFPFNEKSGYGHTGGIDGFTSILSYFPEDSLAVAYITNGEVYPMNDILIGVLSIYYKRPYKLPNFSAATVKYSVEELDSFTGVYASADIPLKITVSRKEQELIAQATGQSSFPLSPADKNKFRFDQAGVEMEFFPEKKELILNQGGASYTFKKEN